MKLIEILTEKNLCRLLQRREFSQFVDASAAIIQRVFNALAQMDIKKEIKPDPDVCESKSWVVESINLA